MSAPAPGGVAILATADFDAAVWTNKQYLAVGLGAHLPVLYIDSLGLRRPTLSRSDLGRLWRRLRPAQSATAQSATAQSTTAKARPPKVTVLSPKVVPLHSSAIARAINRRLLQRTVARQMRAAGVGTLWTFSPLTYGLERAAGRLVYHCVDLLHHQPGLPAQVLLAAEREIVQIADVVIASSAPIAEHLRALGRRDVLIWENVAQTELFDGPDDEQRRPRAIFAGNVTPLKIDIDLLTEIADAGIELAIAGPAGIDGTSDVRLDALLARTQVNYLGNLDLRALASELRRSRVGLIPYARNDLTRGIFPMKTYEYLAAGLEVVSTELASFADADIDGLRLVPRSEFVESVRRAIETFSPDQARTRATHAGAHSWTSRIDEALKLVTPTRAGRLP